MSRNTESAAVSLPSQLRRETAVNRQRYVWRTDLARSQPFWRGWYTGLSELFLGVPVPKVLVLAGSDRLDKALTIGQMQGKFQMSLLPQVPPSLPHPPPQGLVRK
jgi:protein phosphatase methylesterase 1